MLGTSGMVTSAMSGGPGVETHTTFSAARGRARGHRLQYFCPRRIWAAGVAGRFGSVFQAELDHSRRARPAQLRDKGQHEIDACRDAAPGQDVAVPYDAALIHDGAEDRKRLPPCPVAGCTAAAEKAVLAQNERPGAHRSQIARGCSEPGDLFHEEIILDRSEAATAAWHQEHIARVDRSQVIQVRKGEAVRRNRCTSERSHPDMQVGCTREKLVRPCEVELGHPLVHRHYYGDWL